MVSFVCTLEQITITIALLAHVSDSCSASGPGVYQLQNLGPQEAAQGNRAQLNQA